MQCAHTTIHEGHTHRLMTVLQENILHTQANPLQDLHSHILHTHCASHRLIHYMSCTVYILHVGHNNTIDQLHAEGCVNSILYSDFILCLALQFTAL